jgi:hypothetical protein
LEQSLRQLVVPRGPAVSIRKRAFPDLEEIFFNLNGAQLREAPPRPSLDLIKTDEALRTERLQISAERMALGGGSFDLTLKAEQVVFRQARDRNGNIVLLLHGAAEGRLELAIRQTDLEAIIGEIARKAVSEHGVIIEGIRLCLQGRGPRAIAAEATCRVRKLFMRTDVCICGELDIDDQLVARLHGLSCSGDDTIAALACGILNPRLKKLEGRAFNLLALPIGEVRLRDVRVEVNAAVKVSAKFGSASTAAPV